MPNTRRGASLWLALGTILVGVLVLVWLYPLAYLDAAGEGEGEICVGLYGIPGDFAAAGLQPTQVVPTQSWSFLPPGWSCEFRAYQSDLIVIREPAGWHTWAAMSAAALLVAGALWFVVAWRRRCPTPPTTV